MSHPIFLSKADILFIHKREIETAGGASEIRENDGVIACVEAPKASFDGEFLNSLLEMAASYIVCLTIRHPFVDGNKRTALASALTFLYLNGYSVNESYETELADIVLDFLLKKISKEDIAFHFEQNATLI